MTDRFRPNSWPGWLAPSGGEAIALRQIFLKAVAELAPEVIADLAHLRRQLDPSALKVAVRDFHSLWQQTRSNTAVNRSRTSSADPVAATLKAVEAWAQRWNLMYQERPAYWVVYQGLVSLEAWSYLSPSLPEDHSLFRSWPSLDDPEDYALWGPPRLHFEAFWDPVIDNEDKATARKRILQQFERQLNQYLDEVEHSLQREGYNRPRPVDDVSREAVLYVVKKLPLKEILPNQDRKPESYYEAELYALRKKIIRFLKSLPLDSPRHPGRPRKQ